MPTRSEMLAKAASLPKGDPERRRLLAQLRGPAKQAGPKESFQIVNAFMFWEVRNDEEGGVVREHQTRLGNFDSLRDMLKGLDEVPSYRYLHNPKNWGVMDDGHIIAVYTADEEGWEDDDGHHTMEVQVKFQFARVYTPSQKEVMSLGIPRY